MAEQERRQTERTDETPSEVTEEVPAADQGEEIVDKIDDLLDEIDSVLEENAEEFVKNYVQKGGE
jgi:ubiquitin-like protein Pup